MCLVGLSIPQFLIVLINMRLADVVRVWNIPEVSVCLRTLNVGGLVGVDLGRLLGLNITTYVNRSRSSRMLEIPGQQLRLLSNFRQMTRLNLLYSNLNSDSFSDRFKSLVN